MLMHELWDYANEKIQALEAGIPTTGAQDSVDLARFMKGKVRAYNDIRKWAYDHTREDTDGVLFNSILAPETIVDPDDYLLKCIDIALEKGLNQ